jgi:hypothetical protein
MSDDQITVVGVTKRAQMTSLGQLRDVLQGTT